LAAVVTALVASPTVAHASKRKVPAKTREAAKSLVRDLNNPAGGAHTDESKAAGLNAADPAKHEKPALPPGAAAADPAADPATAAAGIVVDAAPGAAPATESSAAADALTAENMATKPKPKGFRYTIVRAALIDEVTETLLYVRKKKDSKHTVAIPIPMDRKLLGKCIAGGTIKDLVKSATVTVKYDPKGVVRPEIVLIKRTSVEVLDNAKVLDRGGRKLYIVTADGGRRGFEIEGDISMWDTVVLNGKADALKPGTKIKVEHDPSGREPLKITLLDAPKADGKPKSKGCGCSVVGSTDGPMQPGPIGVVVLLVGSLFALRLRATPKAAHHGG